MNAQWEGENPRQANLSLISVADIAERQMCEKEREGRGERERGRQSEGPGKPDSASSAWAVKQKEQSLLFIYLALSPYSATACSVAFAKYFTTRVRAGDERRHFIFDMKSGFSRALRITGLHFYEASSSAINNLKEVGQTKEREAGDNGILELVCQWLGAVIGEML